MRIALDVVKKWKKWKKSLTSGKSYKTKLMASSKNIREKNIDWATTGRIEKRMWGRWLRVNYTMTKLQ